MQFERVIVVLVVGCWTAVVATRLWFLGTPSALEPFVTWAAINITSTAGVLLVARRSLAAGVIASVIVGILYGLPFVSTPWVSTLPQLEGLWLSTIWVLVVWVPAAIIAIVTARTSGRMLYVLTASAVAMAVLAVPLGFLLGVSLACTYGYCL
jgi:hypothetical protein